MLMFLLHQTKPKPITLVWSLKNLNRCMWYEKPIMLVRCIIYWHSFLHWSSLKFVYTSGKIHIQKFGWSTEVVRAPSPRGWSMDQVHRGGPWTGSTSGGPWTRSTGVVHEPGPRAGVHGRGPQGWSTDRASMFCKCPEIFAVIRILALNTRKNGKAAKLPKVKLNFARRSFYCLVASILASDFLT